MSTLSDIPGIDVTAEYDDLFGKFATDNLANDVGRIRIR